MKSQSLTTHTCMRAYRVVIVVTVASLIAHRLHLIQLSVCLMDEPGAGVFCLSVDLSRASTRADPSI